MYNTTKYITVLPQIIHGYNMTFHTGIKKIPNEVREEDAQIIDLTNRKYNKAKQEEVKFNNGDVVRYILNRKQFEKGTLPKWSKITHKVSSHTEHTYTLDNGKLFKYYELQMVKENEHVTRAAKEPTREELRRENHNKRTLRKEGIDLSNIITGKRKRE